MFTIGQRVNTPEGTGTVTGVGTTFEGKNPTPIPRIMVRLTGGGATIIRGNALYSVS